MFLEPEDLALIIFDVTFKSMALTVDCCSEGFLGELAFPGIGSM